MADKEGYLAEGKLETVKGLEEQMGYSKSPSEWRENKFLTVTLNLPNSITGKFLIDTASPQSIISKATEKMLGNFAKKNNPWNPTEDYRVKIDQVLLDGMPLGEFKPFVTADRFLPLEMPEVMGIIGLDFLSNFDVDFNFKEGTMQLFRQGMLLRHNPSIPGGSQVDVGVRLNPRGALETEVQLFQDNKEGPIIPAVIDTGLSYTMLNWAAANLIGADKAGKGGVRLGHAFAAGSDGKPTPLAEVPAGVRFPSAIRPLQVSQRVLTIGDDEVFDNVGYTDQPAVVLGLDVLADSPWANRMVFSLALERMRLCTA
eukprot:CAMPEP_0167799114 /NCGR_PEP_ID=MMETSP0111_2-20121227/16777_1 /TAXON_ID=91324 /ORGANISM="Lotharella globosa, Strain CCCM811" /LENGTH=313 /DNA_ID=CAMNT_0007693789 /DNA_START=30 /DNA_END=968 /DNA_ORIENTATION=-